MKPASLEWFISEALRFAGSLLWIYEYKGSKNKFNEATFKETNMTKSFD